MTQTAKSLKRLRPAILALAVAASALCWNFSVYVRSRAPFDRGEKFAHYRTLDTLREYVLIAQDKRRIERFARQEDGQWLLSVTDGPEGLVVLASIGCELSLSNVCDKVDFGQAQKRISRIAPNPLTLAVPADIIQPVATLESVGNWNKNQKR